MADTTPLHEKTFASDVESKLPRPFVLRRLHSLMGLWIVIYLCEHLLVNAQAAFFFQDDGHAFVRMVTAINQLPFLKVIEIVFLGVPFFIHGLWGIFYALTGKLNAHSTNGTQPALPQYKRNHAYSWQRITSWLLLVGIAAHVIHMRFVEYPVKGHRGDSLYYMLPVKEGKGLHLVAEKLYVQLIDRQGLMQKKENLRQLETEITRLTPSNPSYYSLVNEVEEQKEWIQHADKKKLKDHELLAVAPNAGAAFFLIVRQAFTHPLIVVLYSLLVVASTYHAFNGLWTFLITWGVTLTRRSQFVFRRITNFLMGVVTLLGLLAAWGTYFTTLFWKG